MQITQLSGTSDINVPFVNPLHGGYRFLGVRKFAGQPFLVIHWQDGVGPDETINLVNYQPGSVVPLGYRFLGNWIDEVSGEMKHLYQF